MKRTQKVDPAQLIADPDLGKLVAEILEDARIKRLEGLCPTCGVMTSESYMRDELSRREYRISGLCQQCQDTFFDDLESLTEF